MARYGTKDKKSLICASNMCNQSSIHLLIVEDDTIIRKSLIRLIADFNFPLSINEASSGVEVLNILAVKNNVDILLLDIEMREVGGIQLLKTIRNKHYKTKVIILTRNNEDALIAHLLKIGVHCFLTKSCEPAELEKAILEVYYNDIYYSDNVVKIMKQGLIKNNNRVVDLDLSVRELEVASLLRDGRSTKQIAADLNLSVRTIESYRKTIMRKTKCCNVAELIALIYRTNLLPESSKTSSFKDLKASLNKEGHALK